MDERFEYNKDYREFLQKIIKETHELYCTRRDLIEEEIRQRQARWRKTDTGASPQARSTTEETSESLSENL